MRVLFTGATGFSGFHFARTLAEAGHEVVCTLRQRTIDYSQLRGERVRRLQPVVRLVEGVTFGTDSFVRLLSDGNRFDLLCHHAADVANYKSPDFDPVRALENNTKNLATVLSEFKKAGGKGVVLTGTLFEPDEGKGDARLRAFSPYGLSKGLTWQMFRYYCEVGEVPLGKFVSPNPFGPWEERGFTPYLMETWQTGKTAQVQTPDYVRDNCHISVLAQAYLAFTKRVVELRGGWISTSPSGYAESQGAFTARVAREVSSRTKWPCAFELRKQLDFSEPLVRSNREPLALAFPQWDERGAWDDFVQFYTRQI